MTVFTVIFLLRNLKNGSMKCLLFFENKFLILRYMKTKKTNKTVLNEYKKIFRFGNIVSHETMWK